MAEGDNIRKRIRLKREAYDGASMLRLRHSAGGDVYMIIYLKMLVLSHDNGWEIEKKSCLQTLSEEIAEAIGEHCDNVELCLNFLRKLGLAEFIEGQKDPCPIPAQNKPKPAPRFNPPTVEEVEEYCSENMLAVDPERFVDYYKQNGWMAGRNHMKDWKAAARNWHRREQERFNGRQKERKTTDWDINDL